MDWITLVSLTGSALGFLLALRLAATPTENRVGAWTLAGFLACVSFLILDGTFYRHGWFARIPWFYGVANPFIAASGPTFFLYARATTNPAFCWRWTTWLHFIPTGLFLVTHIPIFLLPAEEKIRMAQADLEPAVTLTERFASVGVFNLYLLTYFVLAWWQFWRRRERIVESREEGRSHPLRGIGLFATLIVVLNIVSAILDFTPWMLTGVTILALAAVLSIFTAFWFITNPVLLVEVVRLPEQSEVTDPVASVPAGNAPAPDPHSEQRQPLPEETADVGENEPPADEETRRLAAKLKRLMETEKPYLEAGLSLQALADRLGTTRHRASDAIKCGYGATFYQVVAGYRAREAGRTLRTEDGRARTIADVAFSVGFNTLSAFNVAFRSEYAMTPKEYRESARRAENV